MDPCGNIFPPARFSNLAMQLRDKKIEQPNIVCELRSHDYGFPQQNRGGVPNEPKNTQGRVQKQCQPYRRRSRQTGLARPQDPGSGTRRIRVPRVSERCGRWPRGAGTQ